MENLGIIHSNINHKGGINNLQVSVIVNDRLERIKAFTGKTAKKRAELYLKKLEN